jgi:hypothetical protein
MSQPNEEITPQSGEFQTPTSASSKTSDLGTVRRRTRSDSRKRGADDSIIRPENVLQRLKRLPEPKQNSHQNLPIASTPRVSPDKIAESLKSPPVLGNNVNLQDEAYSYTPTPSDGAQLESPPQPLLEISGEMTDNNLQDALSLLEVHINSLARLYGDTPEDLKKANAAYKKLYAYLNRLRVIAAARSLDDVQLKCSDIANHLESYKMKWQIHSNNTSKSSESFFHGFNSIDFNQAAANLPSASNHAKVIKELGVRMRALESATESFHHINPKISQLENQIKSASMVDPLVNQRVIDLEATLSTRMSTLEASVARIDDLFKVQSASCTKSSESQRSLQKDHVSLQESTQKDINCLTEILSTITARLEQGCNQDDTPSQPEVSAVNKPSQGTSKDNLKVNSWLQHHHSDVQTTDQPKDVQDLGSQRNKPPQEFPLSKAQGNHEDNTDDENKSNASCSSTLDVYGRSLRRQMKSLGKLLFPEPSDTLDKATLNDMYRNRLPLVDSERRDLQRSLREYLKMRPANLALCDEVEDSLDSADQWSANIRGIYLNNGHHKKSQTKSLYDTLPKFSSNSEIDIFEFLRRFESLTTDFEISEERAELFFSKYLTASLQDEVVKVKENYDKMKGLLLNRYGDLDTITSNILMVVIKEKMPTNNSDFGVKLTYYRKLQSAFQKIDKLVAIPDVSTKEVEDFIFGHQFLKKLSQLLPEQVLESFVDAMNDLGQNITKIRGKIAFKTMLNCTNRMYEKIDSMTRNTDFFSVDKSKKEKEKQKSSSSKQANHAYAGDESSSSDDDIDIKRGKGVHFQNKDRSGDRKERPVSSKKFPCIFKDHKHNLSECVEFFLLSPKERVERKKEIFFKYCTFCLQSNKDCKYRHCSNVKSLPDVLQCKSCVTNAKNNHPKPRPAYSIFFCINDKHVKPSNSDILKALEEYIPGFTCNLLNAPVNLACHLQILSSISDSTKPASMSRPVKDDELPQVFNTLSGCLEDPAVSDLIMETNEDSIGVMQILNVGGKNLLTLYDRGANQHLIHGETAETLGMKVHTQEQATVGVISGNKIWTGYGMYELYLGPTVEGKFYQLTCQGMKSITAGFPKYSLEEVNKEALEYADIHPSTPLPSYVGGDSIKLLIGLKNAELEPVCVLSLPSGIGLFKSVFKDVFGSVYCYGGPNRVFSDIHKKFGGNVNHIYSYFTEVINQYRGSPYSALKSILDPEIVDTGYGVCHYKEKSFAYSYQSSTGCDVRPTPLTQGDFDDLDLNTFDDLEPAAAECSAIHCSCPSTIVAFKAKVPLSKLKTYIDEEDKDDTINFRCEVCMRCKCATSSTTRMISLTEQVEQEAIEKSVSIDLENKRVLVDLPFTSPPEIFLSERHGSDSNYSQALKVYKSQCRLPDNKRDHVRQVIVDLQKKGFLKKLSDLPDEHIKLVKDSPFKHYMPWRTYEKISTSTALRIVVDPSMSGLNLILAKGQNKMNKLTDVLLRARTMKHLWSSDVSKLYNCLHLKPTSYAYQLFLYHDSMDPDATPEIYVMVVAWYGVTPSSNQAIFALEELSRLQYEDYPLAFIILHNHIYVDDILGGGESKDISDKQISEVRAVLASGGFNLKYVVQSGEMLEGEDNLKVLGYRWHTVRDKLSPGFVELNFNKKNRGLKAPNAFPVTTAEDVTKLMTSLDVTRRIVVSKLAELWEPMGIWEPLKVQLKLSAQTLNGLNWDMPLLPDVQEYWHGKFKEFIDIPKLEVDRSVLSWALSEPDSKIRLLCLSDAAARCGGAAIYAGKKLVDGTYSCYLLTSRSKMMCNTIPRNELESIRIGANLALEVKNALGDQVSDILFFTDSQIALSWCHNKEKKLRLFVLNRVSEIRRMIMSITESSTGLPLYHIDGKINMADLLTKPNNLKPADLHSGSEWLNGLPWMTAPLANMPILKYTDIQLSAQQKQLLSQECFPDIIFPSQMINHLSDNNFARNEPHCLGCSFQPAVGSQICYGISYENPHCITCNCVTKSSFASQVDKGSSLLVDIIYHGYEKARNIMSHVYDFIWTKRHKTHQSLGVEHSWTCKKCQAIQDSGGVATEYIKVLKMEATNYFLRQESTRLLKVLPKDKLSKFQLENGILYMHGRLAEETEVSTKDLDFKVFFDNTDIKGKLPVVSSSSDLFFSLLMHIHHKVRKHAGNQITFREISKHVYPIHNARRIIQVVRRNCPRCRILLRKTLELTMGNHPEARLTITPVFYNCMMDICYGFPGKPHNNSRTSIKIYALVICCLLTSATSILAIESLETQQVVLALERHSSRHGIPSTIFVDNGTQLLSLESVEMNLRDANHQLRESVGLEIIPSTAKSHEERGRVERRIRTLREMLIKTATKTDMAMTALQWETVFAKMSSEIDDLPIARADGSSGDELGWDLLTPNKLKLGRSNNRAIEGPMMVSLQNGPTNLLKKIRDIQSYWYQLLLDRLSHLIPSPNKWNRSDTVSLGDIVVFRLKDNTNAKLEKWVVGKVSDIQKDGRRILCSYPTYIPKTEKVRYTSVHRSPRDLCIVSAASDIPLNSKEYFDRIKMVT